MSELIRELSPPAMTRDALLGAERAAEQRVRDAEQAWLVSLVDHTPEEQAAALTAVTEARAASRAARQAMLDGFDAWTRYAAAQEAARHARETGGTS